MTIFLLKDHVTMCLKEYTGSLFLLAYDAIQSASGAGSVCFTTRGHLRGLTRKAKYFLGKYLAFWRAHPPPAPLCGLQASQGSLDALVYLNGRR